MIPPGFRKLYKRPATDTLCASQRESKALNLAWKGEEMVQLSGRPGPETQKEGENTVGHEGAHLS